MPIKVSKDLGTCSAQVVAATEAVKVAAGKLVSASELMPLTITPLHAAGKEVLAVRWLPTTRFKI